jgi:hypothetical protein
MGNGKATSPFTLAQCLEILSLYQTLKDGAWFSRTTQGFSLIYHTIPETEEGTQFTTEGDGVRGWFVSYMMIDILQARGKFHHGEVSAATTIEPSTVAASGRAKRVLDICLLLFSFGAHKRYRKRFRRTHTNAGVHVTTFRASVAGTLQEWNGKNICSRALV